MERIMPNYWVVGATWGGHDDQSDKFIRIGIASLDGMITISLLKRS
jgi:hypothetical protein